MTNSKSSSRTTSTSKVATADLTLLFHEPTIDIANRLSTLLEIERKPQYQCHDYLEATTTTTTDHDDSCYSTSINSNDDSSSINNKKKIVTPTSRSKIVSWLNDCVDYLEVSRECVAVAMSYVDRVMSSTTTTTVRHRHLKNIIRKAREDVTIYQLLSLSALYIALKQFATLLSLDINATY